jgi:hypothetical protein
MCVEKTSPFSTAVYEADPHVWDEAMAKIEEAADLWHHCQETQVWSSQYNDQPQVLQPAGWFFTKQI